MKTTTTAINFRLQSQTKAEVDDVAARFGLTATDLIRISIIEKLDEIGRTGKLEIRSRSAKGDDGGSGGGKKGKKKGKRG
ncbi:MAG: hypothetical protein AAGD22_12535 [Verrucomicrobiota bacterium]